MPQLDGRPDMAVEQAPPQLQNLVASTNALLASLSSVAKDLQAATSPNQDTALMAQQIDAAIDHVQASQQSLAEATQAGVEDVLTDQQATAVDRAAYTISSAANELRGGEISAETRNQLDRQGAELGQMLRSATDRAAELQASFPTGGTDQEIATHRAAVQDVGVQIQSLEATRSVVEAAAAIVAQVTAQVTADSQPAIEQRAAEEFERKARM